MSGTILGESAWLVTIDARGLDKGLADAKAKTMAATDAMNKSTAASMKSMGTKLSSVGSTMTSHITLPIVAGAAAVVTASAKYEKSMVLIRTQAGASAAEVKKMSAALLDLAPKVGFGPDALAQSLYHVESSGYRSATALDIVTKSAMLAKIGQSDLET